MKKNPIDLGLTALDELFMDDKSRAEAQLPKIHEIPLSEIDEFPDHPFHVRLDEDMDQLVESIKTRGIITPVTLRQKEDGRYEIVSGHRRTKACELAGLTTVKAEIKELTRDEAVILMVESNLQRTTILPSEKAFSYKMRLDAMKRQGKRLDLTSTQVGPKFVGTRSNEDLAHQANESKTQIQRYIRLNSLIPSLLERVDSGTLKFVPAAESISYLTEKEQIYLAMVMERDEVSPSMDQAKRLKQLSAERKLAENIIDLIMREEKPLERKVTLRNDKLERFFPKNYTPKQMEDVILKLLEGWQRKRQQEQER